MTDERFGFYFERAGLSGPVGAISSAEQFFEGSNKEESLVREVTQNSIDATRDGQVTRLEFELTEISTDSIPDIENLRKHIKAAELITRNKQGHSRIERAAKVSEYETVPVLRISDFGTTGLQGDESVKATDSPLVALTRGAGISKDDDERGGSFGIGSSAYTMMSEMRTVFYSTIPLGSTVPVATAHSRLASHQLEDERYMADGFFTNLENDDDFEYPRNWKPFMEFEERTETGTDIYILAYRLAELDASLECVRDAFITNFMVAIHRGTLEVTAKTPIETWSLNKETLPGYVKGSPQHAAFFTALSDPSPYTGTCKTLGELKLYAHFDDDLEKSLYTTAIRKPLMKIETYQHVVPSKYAAILDCSNPQANSLLKELEPPEHRKWDPGRADNGARIVRELKQFIKEGLRSKIGERIGAIIEVQGLDRYLPLGLETDNRPREVGTGDPQDKEASSVVGAGGRSRPEPVRKKSVKINVRKAATTDGGEPVEKGKDRGGSGTRESAKRGFSGTGNQGDGNARISGESITFRSWSDRNGDLVIALHSESSTTGDLILSALGPDGEAEDDFILPLKSAQIITGGSARDLDFTGNILRDVTIESGAMPTQLRLKLQGNRRFRLGVI